MNARNGKIARLPREIREELNERLERSEASPQLLAWLNSLKEVKKLLRDKFGGAPISKQNLCEWRQGGFQEWLDRQELWAKVRNVEDFSRELGQERDNVLADNVTTVLVARYAALIADWDGEVDEKFEAKARVLNGLCRGIVPLQRAQHRAAKNYDDLLSGLEEDRKELKETCKKKLLDQVWSLRREPLLAEAFGGGEAGQKLAKYIIQVENDVPGAKLELPDEVLKKSKGSREESKPKPVKAVKAKRTVVEAVKTDPETAAKPLEDNEIAGAQEEQCSQAQSKSVKVGQTGLAPAGSAELEAETNPAKAPPKEDSAAIIPIGPIGPISPISPKNCDATCGK